MTRGRAPLAVGLACAAALCALLGGALRLGAQIEGTSDRDEEITLDADSLSYDKRANTVDASGDVLIRRGDTTLSADEVRFNRQTSEAEAHGNAVLTSPDAEIRASQMYLDMEKETGELTDADIYSDRLGFSLSGKHIEKREGQSYRIENGRFTTCTCAEGAPSWSIAGDSVDVALDGYGYLEGGTFQILDYPVMWLPKAAFPVFRERQSGFLIPRVGFSNRRGFQLLQPYYININKNQDATVSLDLETSLRVGVLGEYRYAFSRETEGQFLFGYFNQAIGAGSEGVRVPPGANPDVPENRWGIIADHRQGGIGTAEGFVHLLLVGDDLFLREMNTFANTERKDVALRTLPFTTSSAGVVQSWSRVALQGQGVFYQDLVGPVVELTPSGPTPGMGTPTPTPNLTDNESLVIQRAPEGLVEAQKQFGYGLMGKLNGSVVNFQRSLGLTGVRGDVRPEGILRLPLGRSFVGTLHAAFRETAYGLTENQMSGGFTGGDPAAPPIDLPSGSSREIVELRSDFSTQFARTFDFPYFGLDKLKHTIEPELDYLYIPPVDQSDLPVFDGIDRINKRSLVTYGFSTRLLGRSAGGTEGEHGEVFELSRLSVAQSYDFIRDIAPTSRIDPTQPVNPGQPGDHFSDIDFALRVNPNPNTSVRAYATYDTSENNLSSATVGVHLRDPTGLLEPPVGARLLTHASLKVEYRFITDSILQLLDSSLSVPLTDRFAVLYAMRYDINAGTFLENYTGFRLLSACDCWALNVGFIQTHNPNEVQVQAQFTLAGLGSSMGGLGSY